MRKKNQENHDYTDRKTRTIITVGKVYKLRPLRDGPMSHIRCSVLPTNYLPYYAEFTND